MPIKLIPPRKEAGQTNWYGRGTHLGVFVDRSTKTDRKALARKIVKQWERGIERDLLEPKPKVTFLSAAVTYMKLGGERRPLSRLIAHFGETPLAEIGQAEIDAAALALLPNATNATRNREVYTPVSAVLKHAGILTRFRRPAGSRGKVMSGWLKPEQAQRLIRAAYEIDAEFGLLCYFLLYTGIRRSEAMLWFETKNLDLQESFAYIPKSKNGEPIPVYLPPHLVAALANHPRGLDRPGRVFRYRPGGRSYDMLYAAAAAAQIELPSRQAFHIFRHTHVTWRRRYAGASLESLIDTRLWKDERSVRRYAHAVFTEEAALADLLPEIKIKAS